jgi:hypothetical protein
LDSWAAEICQGKRQQEQEMLKQEQGKINFNFYPTFKIYQDDDGNIKQADV